MVAASYAIKALRNIKDAVNLKPIAAFELQIEEELLRKIGERNAMK